MPQQSDISKEQHKNIKKIPVLEGKINTILALTAGQFVAVLALVLTVFQLLFSGFQEGLIMQSISNIIAAIQ